MELRKNHLFNGALYAAATLGTIIGEMKGVHTLQYVCKPLMMVVLSSWFFFNSRRMGDRFTLLVQTGLFFSLIGDIALMFQHYDEFNFLVGLGAFAIGLLCYTLAFAQNIADAGGGPGMLVSIGLSIVLVTYSAVFGSMVLSDVEDDVLVPAGFYAVVITLMGVAAALRFGRTYMASFVMVFLGAIFFIASDSILATAHFVRLVEHANWSVVLTYAIAQYLIAFGCLRHVLDPEEVRRRAALDT